MTTNELVDAFILHVERTRHYESQIAKLIYTLEKWQAVAIAGIPEEGIIAGLEAYDMEHKNDIG